MVWPFAVIMETRPRKWPSPASAFTVTPGFWSAAGMSLLMRPALWRTWPWASVALAALALAYFAATGGLREVVRSGPLAILFATAMWVSFELPRVTVSDGGVTVRNVWRTIHVPWPTFRGLDSTWSLVLHTSEGDVASWAIPATSGFAARAARDVAGQAGKGVNANSVGLATARRDHAG